MKIKKQLAIGMSALLLLCAVGCVKKGTDTISSALESVPQTVYKSEELTDFTATTFLTNGSGDESHPESVMFESEAVLQAYLDAYDEMYDFTDLKKKCTAYTEDWFADHCLVILYLQEENSLIDHQVTTIVGRSEMTGKASRTYMDIDLNRIVPASENTEKALWHITVELPKNAADYHVITVNSHDVTG